MHSKDAGDCVPGATHGHGLYVLLREIRQHALLAIGRRGGPWPKKAPGG